MSSLQVTLPPLIASLHKRPVCGTMTNTMTTVDGPFTPPICSPQSLLAWLKDRFPHHVCETHTASVLRYQFTYGQGILVYHARKRQRGKTWDFGLGYDGPISAHQIMAAHTLGHHHDTA